MAFSPASIVVPKPIARGEILGTLNDFAQRERGRAEARGRPAGGSPYELTGLVYGPHDGEKVTLVDFDRRQNLYTHPFTGRSAAHSLRTFVEQHRQTFGWTHQRTTPHDGFMRAALSRTPRHSHPHDLTLTKMTSKNATSFTMDQVKSFIPPGSLLSAYEASHFVMRREEEPFVEPVAVLSAIARSTPQDFQVVQDMSDVAYSMGKPATWILERAQSSMRYSVNFSGPNSY